jgi:HK97 family phage portal protein
MQKFQSDLFSNGGMPILALTFPDGLTDEQWQRLNKDLQAQAKKAREKGVPFILEGQGISGQSPKVEKMSQTAADAEFLKANNAVFTDVCRYYGVPPHKVYLFDGVKYDNVTPYERAYVTDSLVPIFDAITEALHPVLLTEDEQDEYFIMFDKDQAYAADPEQRQKVINDQWKTGLITKNQALDELGFNTIGDAGEVYLFSGNFVMTDTNNEVILKAGGNAPGEEDTEKTDDKDKAKAPVLSLVKN